MNKIKLGILGLSEGNGHPYSWSAIFNGYDPKAMAQCPFPTIPEYLAKQQFPRDAIEGGEVTHVWTQERAVSEHIAKACRIENIVSDHREMIGQVDAVLLARDDAEQHYEMSEPFIKAGLPIYIDKPLAYDVQTAERIYAFEKYPGQIFTCSALTYAAEFQLNKDILARTGKIKSIEAFVIKGWDKYGVHVIEPVLAMMGDQGKMEDVSCERKGERTKVSVRWASGLATAFTSLGHPTERIRIVIRGEKGEQEMVFVDTFYAFRAALQTFINIVLKKEKAQSQAFILKVIQIIESGLVHV